MSGNSGIPAALMPGAAPPTPGTSEGSPSSYVFVERVLTSGQDGAEYAEERSPPPPPPKDSARYED